ncbi:MgtC/SapB family protein [Lysinibacillus yapensis]|uniref:MgtC/SapB family protein n=1 Tax=Ureibacillus yapensis TaxID=2304605 RepID=A0A396SF44_9BACL|nr:MgtC/SapB family protein [Lysinibacillus yapensis]RHW37478.1 MgtC/SapB family protein [Lysinibacillus yapensis]
MVLLSTFEQHWELYVRLVTALFIGALIGLERARKNKDAGVRTHALVSLGSAAIMVLSGFSEGQYRDPMRLAAQVVSGIGFIGAGLIWMDKNNVKRGLTTAANVWVTAGLGLIIGYGLYDIAIVTFLLMLIALNLPKMLKKLGLSRPYQNDDDDDD